MKAAQDGSVDPANAGRRKRRAATTMRPATEARAPERHAKMRRTRLARIGTGRSPELVLRQHAGHQIDGPVTVDGQSQQVAGFALHEELPLGSVAGSVFEANTQGLQRKPEILAGKTDACPGSLYIRFAQRPQAEEFLVPQLVRSIIQECDLCWRKNSLHH